MQDPLTLAPASADKLASLKQLTMVTYILYALSAFIGFSALVATCWSMKPIPSWKCSTPKATRLMSLRSAISALTRSRKKG